MNESISDARALALDAAAAVHDLAQETLAFARAQSTARSLVVAADEIERAVGSSPDATTAYVRRLRSWDRFSVVIGHWRAAGQDDPTLVAAEQAWRMLSGPAGSERGEGWNAVCRGLHRTGQAVERAHAEARCARWAAAHAQVAAIPRVWRLVACPVAPPVVEDVEPSRAAARALTRQDPLAPRTPPGIGDALARALAAAFDAAETGDWLADAIGALGSDAAAPRAAGRAASSYRRLLALLQAADRVEP